MKKVICDYCKRPTEEFSEYKFPSMVPNEAKRANDIAMSIFGCKIQNVTRDVCPECRERIATLLELLSTGMFNSKNKDTTTAVTVSGEG